MWIKALIVLVSHVWNNVSASTIGEYIAVWYLRPLLVAYVYIAACVVRMQLVAAWFYLWGVQLCGEECRAACTSSPLIPALY